MNTFSLLCVVQEFCSRNIDGSALADLTLDDVEDMGIPAEIGCSLLKAISTLQHIEGVLPSHSTGTTVARDTKDSGGGCAELEAAVAEQAQSADSWSAQPAWVCKDERTELLLEEMSTSDGRTVRTICITGFAVLGRNGDGAKSIALGGSETYVGMHTASLPHAHREQHQPKSCGGGL